jgi:hypothetical protein
LNDLRLRGVLPSKPIRRVYITGSSRMRVSLIIYAYTLRSASKWNDTFDTLLATNDAAFQFLPLWQLRYPLPLPAAGVALEQDPRAVQLRKEFKNVPLPGWKNRVDSFSV